MMTAVLVAALTFGVMFLIALVNELLNNGDF